MLKSFFVLLLILFVIRDAFSASIESKNVSTNLLEVLGGTNPTTIRSVASNRSICEENHKSILPDDVWRAPSIVKTYKVYNSPRGVYISTIVNGVECASKITGMNNLNIMHSFECKSRFFLSGEDGKFYSVEHGETRAMPIDGLPNFSDYSHFNRDTCVVFFRHFQLIFFISRNGGDEKCKVEVTKIPKDCWDSENCKKFMGMREINYKLESGQLKATQLPDDQKPNESKPEGCP